MDPLQYPGEVLFIEPFHKKIESLRNNWSREKKSILKKSEIHVNLTVSLLHSPYKRLQIIKTEYRATLNYNAVPSPKETKQNNKHVIVIYRDYSAIPW